MYIAVARQKYSLVMGRTFGLTNLHHDLSKVVGMPTPLEETNVTDRAGFFTRTLLEAILLDIAHSFHCECDGEEYNRNDVRSFPEAGLGILKIVGRIEESDRKTDGPAPQHLENPESKKWEEFVTLVVKAIIGTSLENAEEEESRETSTPEHDEYADDNVAGVSGS